MAVTDVAEFAHLTEADIESLAVELDAIRQEFEDARGARDARYIHWVIRAQRSLEIAGRLLLTASSRRSAWWAGATTLGVAKIIENMEIGHNVMHGQWDWMNDPEIHSTNWEWDNAGAAKHWRYTHNFIHHKYTNILGVDNDLGFSLLRVTHDQKWRPFNLGNLVYNTILALIFEWGVGLQHLEVGRIARGKNDKDATAELMREFLAKATRQATKDYVAFPAATSLSPGATYRSTLTANVFANVIRNVWSNAVIFCGHFPDEAEKFTETDMDDETKGEWYLRQMLGTANFDAGPVLRLMSGNLCYQIEHHLFPDLPSNRHKDIAMRVREVCDKYDLPYTTGSFLLQYAKVWRTIAIMSLPDSYPPAAGDATPATPRPRKVSIAMTRKIPTSRGNRRAAKTGVHMTGKFNWWAPKPLVRLHERLDFSESGPPERAPAVERPPAV